MTQAQRKKLEEFSRGPNSLNKSIRAALDRIEDLEVLAQEAADALDGATSNDWEFKLLNRLRRALDGGGKANGERARA